MSLSSQQSIRISSLTCSCNGNLRKSQKSKQWLIKIWADIKKFLRRQKVTTMVHGAAEYENALAASKMLFGNSTSEELRKLDERTFLAVFSGVPTFDIKKEDLPSNIIELLAVKTQVFPSKGECRKMIQGGGVSINKDKVGDIEYSVSENDIVDGKYILVQKGKKNYFIINVL